MARDGTLHGQISRDTLPSQKHFRRKRNEPEHKNFVLIASAWSGGSAVSAAQLNSFTRASLVACINYGYGRRLRTNIIHVAPLYIAAHVRLKSDITHMR